MLGNHGRSITKAIFTPLARVLARMGVTPNMVTVAGTVATVAIAVICIPQGWIWQGGSRWPSLCSVTLWTARSLG